MKSHSSSSNQASLTINQFINNSLNDFNALTAVLKTISRPSSEANERIKNSLLLASHKDSKAIIKELLQFLLRTSELKGTHPIILTLVSKVIAFAKMLQVGEQGRPSSQEREQSSPLLSLIIDILTLLKSRHKQAETTLRIIQTTYSLIDATILRLASYTLLVRIFSICFECCESSPVIQNISVGALMALTETVFSSCSFKEALLILNEMLEYLFREKRFVWIKGKQLKGMVWDIVSASIKCMPRRRLEQLTEDRAIKIIMEMYAVAAERAFEEGEGDALNTSGKQELQKNIHFKRGGFADFIRYYKTFIYISKHICLAGSHSLRAPFHLHIPRFRMLYSLKRGPKLYLLLEGAGLLLAGQSSILVEEEQAIVLLDVFNKVGEELTHSPLEFDIGGDSGDLYLDRMCGDFGRITDNDFAKLIKRTILSLRKQFEARGGGVEEPSLEEEGSYVPLGKRWERVVRIVMRIIKHLSSLRLREGCSEQAVRRMTGELQFWFTICPTHKLRNLVLEELLTASAVLESRALSIRASQCVQIGCNLIYGYFDVLDKYGLALILRMVLGVRVGWEEGRGYDELEEVCAMAEKLFTEQRIIDSPESFAKTVQAFIICSNGVLADMEQPEEGKARKGHHRQRYLRLVEEVLRKMEGILCANSSYLPHQWDLLSSFWISLASNKNREVKDRTMDHLLHVVLTQLKAGQIAQRQLISLYQEIAKLGCLVLSKHTLRSLREVVFGVSDEAGIVGMMKVLSTMLQAKGIEGLHKEIYEMLETIVREVLFRVRSCERVLEVIDAIGFVSKDKNEEYKVISLIWSVSDHLNMLAPQQTQPQKSTAWKHLFKKIIILARVSAYGETKQSSIHTFTQILGESLAVIGADLFSQILRELYLELFYILMGVGSEEASLDMIRVGIKNLIKISKKCLTIHPETSKGLLRDALSQLVAEISQGKYQSIEHLNEINTLLIYLKEIIQADPASFSLVHQSAQLMVQEIVRVQGAMDRSTYSWKKYSSVFDEFRGFFMDHG